MSAPKTAAPRGTSTVSVTVRFGATRSQDALPRLLVVNRIVPTQRALSYSYCPSRSHCNMKSFAALLALANLAIAGPSLYHSVQLPLGHDQLVTHPGLDLDLAERRLIEVDGQSPVWVTELEKVATLLQAVLVERSDSRHACTRSS